MLKIILIILSILLSIAFFTLLERKLLSMSQLRLGPNKNLYLGIMQPVLDGLKLFKKVHLINIKIFKLVYIIMSFMMLMISLLIWMIIPFYIWNKKMLMIFWVLMIFGLSAFMILMLGWISFSKYGLLGSNRSIVQVLSFEINFTLLMLIPFINNLILNFKYCFSISLFLISFYMLFILFIIETQRSPVDLSEGESELISGYNTELGSLLFTMIFLGEYSNMISLMMFLMILYYKMNFMIFLLFILILMVRSCFPRIRYDSLVKYSWLEISPLIVLYWLMMLIFLKI